MVNSNTSDSEMKSKFIKLIVCGTDTDIGKTVISSLLVQGLNAIYWKPIQSGLDEGGDTARVSNLLSLPPSRCLPETYKFRAAVSPHWAAEKENRLIEPSKIKLPIISQNLIIETAGGVLVPLTRNFLQIDLIQKWDLPIILVAKSGLGTLNHTLLTIEALKKREIPILGIVLNGELHEDNPKTLEQLANIPIIAQLPHLNSLSAKKLLEQWVKQDLEKRIEDLMKSI